MALLQHPTTGRVVDVTGRRLTTLRHRGYTDVSEEDRAEAVRSLSGVDAPQAVQPQAPIDARKSPPEPPEDARREELINEPPVDMRPPNPQGPVAGSVAEADSSIDADEVEDDSGEPPARSALKEEWVEYAESQGVEDADSFTKDELIEKVG